MARTSNFAGDVIALGMNHIARELTTRGLAEEARIPLNAAAIELGGAQGAIDAAQISVDHIESLLRDMLMDTEASDALRTDLFGLQIALGRARQRCSHGLCHIEHADHGMRFLVRKLDAAIASARAALSATSSAGSYVAAEEAAFA